MPMSTAQPEDDAVEAIVTLTDAELPRIKTIAKSLAKKGFDVSHIMESSGLIAGTAKPNTFDDIRGMKGVAALEMSEDVSVGPPDAGVS